MLEEMLKEIEELKSYKKKYECAEQDKKRMSELLYGYMMKEYESMGREDRVSAFKEDVCSCCAFRDCCQIGLPEDIYKPVPSDKGWIPGRVGCGAFSWS